MDVLRVVAVMDYCKQVPFNYFLRFFVSSSFLQNTECIRRIAKSENDSISTGFA